MSKSALAAVIVFFGSACASTGSGGSSGAVAEAGRPRAMKIPQEDVPNEVRAIEAQIEKRAGIMADEVRIEVSRNYEWDVSLSGDHVAPQRAERDGASSESTGAPRAVVRNLDVRARKRIVFWKSGLDVTPFIRITATGDVSYVDADPTTGAVRVSRAGLCKIRDAAIAFDDQAALMDLGGGRPVGVRDARR